MGSGLLVMPPTQNALSYPMPVARMADSLLQTLMVETKRLIHEKEYAVHAVAAALIEHGELIGTELEAVFENADAREPRGGDAVRAPRSSRCRGCSSEEGPAAGATSWPAEETGTAAASWGWSVRPRPGRGPSMCRRAPCPPATTTPRPRPTRGWRREAPGDS